jgi:glycosyl transferase family WbsX
MNDEPKVIAFYLPQFHPVAENDAWWGNGFTEWTKVVEAQPLFDGHYQPHLPGDLGFYDLRVPEVREQQAALARRHGIGGFMYYHYWFGGQRILDRTFQEVLSSGRPDFPFALCWANENWTRVWDAGERSILLEQRYDEVERAEHIEWIVGVFKDARHITVDGRPLFAIYRIQAMPDAQRFVSDLRAAAVAAGLADPYVVKFETHANFDDPGAFGCDAAAQFLPHGVIQHAGWTEPPEGADPKHHFVRYADVVDAYRSMPTPEWTRHECLFPGWDNSPRRREQSATVVVGSTPDRYEEWLDTVYGRSADRGGLVFINAWNEWGEGAHLEPDQRWGDEFLRATARVVLGREPEAAPDDAVADAVLIGPTFAELYLDIYERYVRARRQLTLVDESIRREVERRTRDLHGKLKEAERRNAQLAERLEALLPTLDPERAGT